MTKQEQIEEMAKIMHYAAYGKDRDCENEKCVTCWCPCKDNVEALYNAGYRKVADGAVILTPEERDEEKKEINNILSERDELKAENEKLKEVIADQNELCWDCKKSIKEFGDKIKAKLFSVFGKTICSDLDTQDIADIIDEVLKEV